MKARMENKSNGMVKEVKAGFSWTTFFFGFFVPLFRGDIKWFLIMAAVNIGVVVILGPLGIIPSIVWGFLYNRMYIKELMGKGYSAMSEDDRKIINSYVA